MSSNTTQLLERMRRLREERAAAAAAATARTADPSSSSATAPPGNASPTAGQGAVPSPPPSTGAAASAEASAPSSTTAVATASQLRATIPPALISPPGTRVQYRDTIHDPLCATTRAMTVAKLAIAVLLPSSGTEADAASPRSPQEQCAFLVSLVGNKSAADTAGMGTPSPASHKRPRPEDANTSAVTASVDSDPIGEDPVRVAAEEAERAVMAELRGGLLAKAHAARRRTATAPLDPVPAPTTEASPAQHSLFEDQSYRAACVEAHVEVRGDVRPPCADVNKYDRVDQLAQGVYGVVFSARLSAATSDATSSGEHQDRPQQLYAVKHIKKKWLQDSEVGFPQYLLREFDLLFRMRHPNIIPACELAQLDPLPFPGHAAFANYSEKEAALEKARQTLIVPTSARRSHIHPPSARPRTAERVLRRAIGSSDGDGRSPSIYVSANTSVRDVFLVMDFCPRDLRTYMNGMTRQNECFLHVSSRNHHPDVRRAFLSRVKCIAFQLFNGLAFLHANRVLHRDLKPSNILIDHNGYVKLCDFGLGRQYREGQSLTPTVVTRMYRAPELTFGVRDYSHALDVWAATCILAELFLRRPLFESPDADVAHMRALCYALGIPSERTFPGVFHLPKARDVVREMGVWNREERLADVFAESFTAHHNTDASLIPENGLDLLRQVLRWNPADRLSAAQVLQHPFFVEEPLPCAPSELLVPLPFAPAPAPPVQAGGS